MLLGKRMYPWHKTSSQTQPEHKIKKAILQWLNFQGILALPIKNGATYDAKSGAYRANSSVKGIPDILGCVPYSGRMLAIEVKTPTGRVSKEQQTLIDEINRRGGLAFVARSVDDVKKVLAEEKIIS
jgi:hypothetical protein